MVLLDSQCLPGHGMSLCVYTLGGGRLFLTLSCHCHTSPRIFSHAPCPRSCFSSVASPCTLSHRLPSHVTLVLHTPFQGGCQPWVAPKPQWLCSVGVLGHKLEPRGLKVGRHSRRKL